mgnify:CR=1 FL=1
MKKNLCKCYGERKDVSKPDAKKGTTFYGALLQVGYSLITFSFATTTVGMGIGLVLAVRLMP